MIALKKIGIWIEHHWYVPLIAVVILFVGIASKEKAASLINLLAKNRVNYTKAIDGVDKIRDKQIRDIELVQANKDKQISNLDEKYIKDTKQIENDKNSAQEQLAKESSEEIAKRLKDDFKL